MSQTAGRIDVHNHFIPDFFRAATKAAGRQPATSRGLPAWSAESALAIMDRYGIATAILSISQPGVHFGDDAAARALARRCNEYAAELSRTHVGRFGGFGVLPLPDLDGACAEIAYALDELKLDGIVLFASCEERFLGDPFFEPVLAELDRRKAIAFIHPALHPKARELKLSLPQFVLEYPFDTTRAATNMIFNGTLDRYPNIRFVLSHAGGTLPYLATRLANAEFVDPEALRGRSGTYVMEKLRHFWYDTALSFGPQSLAVLAAVADPAKVVFGSDWPYAPEQTTALTAAAFDNDPIPSPLERAAIERATRSGFSRVCGSLAKRAVPALLRDIEEDAFWIEQLAFVVHTVWINEVVGVGCAGLCERRFNGCEIVDAKAKVMGPVLCNVGTAARRCGPAVEKGQIHRTVGQVDRAALRFIRSGHLEDFFVEQRRCFEIVYYNGQVPQFRHDFASFRCAINPIEERDGPFGKRVRVGNSCSDPALRRGNSRSCPGCEECSSSRRRC